MRHDTELDRRIDAILGEDVEDVSITELNERISASYRQRLIDLGFPVEDIVLTAAGVTLRFNEREFRRKLSELESRAAHPTARAREEQIHQNTALFD
jgi:hypothetical protein